MNQVLIHCSPVAVIHYDYRVVDLTIDQFHAHPANGLHCIFMFATQAEYHSFIFLKQCNIIHIYRKLVIVAIYHDQVDAAAFLFRSGVQIFF
ncbi:hypothetical protein D3C86_1238230 [compost metagenome]